ncbi:hypothetical protein SAMN06296386_103172 [Lachnospiraceae bacterium]|nr:hypothetical protein SAMN06296386_103172 [Lachnospiraceae bacterium]
MSNRSSKKNVLILRIVISFVLIITILSFIAGDYMIKFASRRSSNASNSISKSLTVFDDPEQQAFEEKVRATKRHLLEESALWSDKTPGETLTITSFDGLKLNALLHRNPEPSHLWMIGVHGFQNNMSSMFPFAKKYYEKGYNVLTPDLRGCGTSEGEQITMGILDKRDIIQWINVVIDMDPDAKIVLHGISMGASTIMMVSGEDDLPSNVKVIVEDCGYSSVWAEYADKLDKLFHLPAFPVLYTANIMCRINNGYFFSDGSCIEALKKNKTPMFFVHGDADDYNPFYMLDEVYEADACEIKEKMVVERARHGYCSYAEPDRYWNSVWSFIDKNL